MNKIAVFCSASEQIESVYCEKAQELGNWLGSTGKWLVFGGSDMGLMDIVSRAAKQHGGMIMGVVPTCLEERGRVSDILDVTFRTDNLSDRKDTMLSQADVMVALPGGVGTLDEIFHVMASATIGYHKKKVIFYNVNGFWDEIIAFLHKLETTGFAHKPLNKVFLVANNFDELIKLLE